MALIKNTKSQIGINGDYWRIVAVETHYGGPNQLWPSKHARPVSFVHVALYADKKARDEGAMSLEMKRIVLDGQSNGMHPDDPEFHKNPDHLPEPTRAAAYAALKGVRDFIGAADG